MQYIQKQPMEMFYTKSCSWKFCNIHRNTHVLSLLLIKLQPWRPAILLKADVLRTPIFLRTPYFEKQRQTAASVHSVSKLEKWKKGNIKLHKSDDLVSGIFRSSPSEVLKKILVLTIFANSKKTEEAVDRCRGKSKQCDLIYI